MPSDPWITLEEILPPDLRLQLAELILEKLAIGYGLLEIDFKDHQVVKFRSSNLIMPRKAKPGLEPLAKSTK